MTRKVLVLFLLASLAACAATKGYERGDLSEGIKDNVSWYCGSGMFGIRAVARFGARWFLGMPVVDLCKAKDLIVEQAATGDSA